MQFLFKKITICKKIKIKVFIGVLLLLFCFLAQAYTGIFNNTPYQVCFTPSGHCAKLIIKQLNAAKNNINVQAYVFTYRKIANALIKAQRRGVKVFVLIDKSAMQQPYNVVNSLYKNKVPFLIDWKPAIMHNKVMIIDGKTVITGSFNFTHSAQTKNAENVLIIHNKELAQQYQRNFNRRRVKSESFQTYCRLSHQCISKWNKRRKFAKDSVI